MKDQEKVQLLNAPVSQTGLFCDAVESIAYQFSAAQKQTVAIKHIMRRRKPAASCCAATTAFHQANTSVFNTIDHDILIDRLQNYTGIQGQALRWFRSYLSDHYNFIYLNGQRVISIITRKVWSTTMIYPRSYPIVIIHIAP